LALIVYSSQAFRDFERIFDFIAADDASLAAIAVEAIREAIAILERHPFIGRPAEEGLRELLISRGRTGYVALYRYIERSDIVLVLALRHQREAGYEPTVE
jgi:addiction module RelE/StbE family toxin